MAQIEFSGTVYFQASGPWVFRPLMIHFWFVGTVYFMRGTVYFRSLMTHSGFLGTVYFQREDRIFYAGGTVYFQHLRTVYLSRPYILSRGPYIFSPRAVYFQPSGPYIFSLDRIFYGWPVTTFQVHSNFPTSARTFQLQRNFPTSAKLSN